MSPSPPIRYLTALTHDTDLPGLTALSHTLSRSGPAESALDVYHTALVSPSVLGALKSEVERVGCNVEPISVGDSLQPSPVSPSSPLRAQTEIEPSDDEPPAIPLRSCLRPCPVQRAPIDDRNSGLFSALVPHITSTGRPGIHVFLPCDTIVNSTQELETALFDAVSELQTSDSSPSAHCFVPSMPNESGAQPSYPVAVFVPQPNSETPQPDHSSTKTSQHNGTQAEPNASANDLLQSLFGTGKVSTFTHPNAGTVVVPPPAESDGASGSRRARPWEFLVPDVNSAPPETSELAKASLGRLASQVPLSGEQPADAPSWVRAWWFAFAEAYVAIPAEVSGADAGVGAGPEPGKLEQTERQIWRAQNGRAVAVEQRNQGKDGGVWGHKPIMEAGRGGIKRGGPGRLWEGGSGN